MLFSLLNLFRHVRLCAASIKARNASDRDFSGHKLRRRRCRPPCGPMPGRKDLQRRWPRLREQSVVKQATVHPRSRNTGVGLLNMSLSVAWQAPAGLTTRSVNDRSKSTHRSDPSSGSKEPPATSASGQHSPPTRRREGRFTPRQQRMGDRPGGGDKAPADGQLCTVSAVLEEPDAAMQICAVSWQTATLGRSTVTKLRRVAALAAHSDHVSPRQSPTRSRPPSRSRSRKSIPIRRRRSA